MPSASIRNRKNSSSGPILKLSNPSDCIRSMAPRSTCRESASYGSPSGVRTSQNILATERSPDCRGSIRKVDGSGMAIMSDSSMALNPVTDEPSKPIPWASASSSSSRVIAKLFSLPTTSVNHSLMNFTSAPSASRSTHSRSSAGVPAGVSLTGPIVLPSPGIRAQKTPPSDTRGVAWRRHRLSPPGAVAHRELARSLEHSPDVRSRHRSAATAASIAEITATSESTTSASNCPPAQRRSSATASRELIALRYTRSDTIAW